MRPRASLALGLALFSSGLSTPASAQPEPQIILQYFETDWAEITRRIPEIAKAGYTALWLPPPTKGAEGVADVGFSVFDRFDLGEYDQRGTVRTKYGTREEVRRMVDEAHRFGIRVYFDIVMNHNANPAKIENAGVTLPPAGIDEFPGTRPLDYHVLPARNAGNGNWEVQNPPMFGSNVYTLGPDPGEGESFVATTPIMSGDEVAGFTHWARAPRIDFNNAGYNEEVFLSLLGLIDFAIEQFVSNGAPTAEDGLNPVAQKPLPRFIRNPDRPDTYPNGRIVEEDIREYMMRWVRWVGDVTDADGLRLDAIKHVGTSFFGSDFANDPIDFNGAFQRNYDTRRSFNDDDDDDGAGDALLFGEAFTGDTGSLLSYRQTGMYLLDFPLLFKMGLGGIFSQWGDADLGQLSFPQGGMSGAYTEFGGLGRTAGVSFVQSHDTGAPGAQPNTAYAFIMSRVGHSVVFYDGNNYSPRTFVQPGRVDALGELSSNVVLDLIDLRRRFARGGMFNRWVGNDAYVYERVVPTPSGGGGAVMLTAITDRTSSDVRFGEFDEFSLVVTEFAPGTVLRELTGHGALGEVTVLDPSAVPTGVRDFALAEYDRSSDFPLPAQYGLVYLQVPAGPDHGYVVYAPATPPVAISITANGQALPTRDTETVGERRTPGGTVVPPSVVRAALATGGFTLEIVTDASADAAYVYVDQPGSTLGGLSPSAGTPEKLFDGYVSASLRANTDRIYELPLDAASFAPGLHLVHVRVPVQGAAGAPPFFTEAKAYLEIADPAPPMDAGTAADAELNDASSAGDASTPVDLGADAGTKECRFAEDPSQRDFDEDGVVDPCDDCPETPSGLRVDSTGCAILSAATRAELDRIVELILAQRFEAALDQNADGVIDVSDFVLRANEGDRP